MKRMFIAAGALLFAAGAVPAQAQEEDAMIVRLQGLDLQSEPGAEIALRRVKNAAVAFCGAPARRFVDKRVRACREEMMGKAVHKLDAPVVTALYETRQGTRTLLASR